jgi:hypothetical protein
MTERQDRLQHKLRMRRYAIAAASCLEVLRSAGIPVGADCVVDVDETQTLNERFGSRLRHEMRHAVSWPANEHAQARARLNELADAARGILMVWLARIDTRPVGIEVPVADMLRAALDVFVDYTADLYLASRDGRSGICVEVDFEPEIERYQLVVWNDDPERSLLPKAD